MADLAKTPVPLLLLGLRRECFSGELELEQQPVCFRFRFVGGQVLQVSSSRPEDALAVRLVQNTQLSNADANRAAASVASGESELASVAGLRKLTPRALFGAVQAQAHHCLRDACRWREGRFSLEPGSGESEGAAAGVDPALAAFEALACWRPHELLDALGDKVSAFPRSGSGDSDELAKLLPQGWPDLTQMLDGRQPAFAAIRGDLASRHGAALLGLEKLGLLRWESTPLVSEDSAEGAEAQTDADPSPPFADIEIEVTASPTRAPEAEATNDAANPAAASGSTDASSNAVREELLSLHERLAEIDHYALLGLDRDARPAMVKRAYLKVAKRLHPDAIAHRGLTDVKEAATEVFAQVTRAHATLSNASNRRDYDAWLQGHVIEDADRVAQAEMLYRKGEILMRAGNFDGALEFLVPAVALWTEEADYQGALGWCLFKRTPPELGRARSHLESAVQLAPDDPVWRERLDHVNAELGS